jgi:hypothetical protein
MWVDDVEIVDGDAQVVRKYVCPSWPTRYQRNADRKAIRDRLIEAMQALRCAQYGVWRRVLYREAKQRWDSEDHGFGWSPTTKPDPEPEPTWGGQWALTGHQPEPPEPPEPQDPDPVGPLPGPDEEPDDGQPWEPWGEPDRMPDIDKDALPDDPPDFPMPPPEPVAEPGPAPSTPPPAPPTSSGTSSTSVSPWVLAAGALAAAALLWESKQ